MTSPSNPTPKRLLALGSGAVLLVGGATALVFGTQSGTWSQWSSTVNHQTARLAKPIAMNRASHWIQENAGLSERARLAPTDRSVNGDHRRLVDSSARSPRRIDEASRVLVNFRDLNNVSRELRALEAEEREELEALEALAESEQTLVGWTGPGLTIADAVDPLAALPVSTFGANRPFVESSLTGAPVETGVAAPRKPQAAASVTVEADNSVRVAAEIAVIENQAAAPPAYGSFLARAGQLGFTTAQIQSIPDESSGGGSSGTSGNGGAVTTVDSIVNSTTPTDTVTDEIMPEVGDAGAPAVVPAPGVVIPGLVLLGSMSVRRRRNS